MDWVKAALLTGLLNIFLMNLAPDTFAADYGRGNACRRNDRLNIEDLDVSPDPIVEGTRISIREGGDTVAQARRVMIKPGITEIDLRPSESYRFRGREHCFNVQVDLEGSRREVDAARKFCAQQRPAWSMRESRDRSFR
jgi:hypothetical protein